MKEDKQSKTNLDKEFLKLKTEILNNFDEDFALVLENKRLINETTNLIELLIAIEKIKNNIQNKMKGRRENGN